MNRGDGGYAYKSIITKGNNYYSTGGFYRLLTNAHYVAAEYAGASTGFVSCSTVGSWTHVAATFNRGNGTITIYRNGEQVYQQDGFSFRSDNQYNSGLLVGYDPHPYYWYGYIDEVRISNAVRSADWIRASYLSQTDSLVTVGSKEEQ